MSFRLLSGNLDGIAGRIVEVEVDLIPALSSFVISGLPGKGIRESRERIRSALENSGYRYPDRHRIVVNLAPATWQKDGAVFDLPIALAILAASGQVPAEALGRWAALGELALDGRIRKVPGALGIVTTLQKTAVAAVVVAADDLGEVRQVTGIRSEGVRNLRQAVSVMAEGAAGTEVVDHRSVSDTAVAAKPDLADVKGHGAIRRALEIAATGEHPMLMVGPPGSGKSFLAGRLPSILPPLDQAERLEVTQIRDVCGLHQEQGLVRDRPFRCPHHSVSSAGLVGGGSPPVPGEVTLAHRGVLFLDEFPEISRRSLEALREPLEAGEVTLSRSQFSRTFPARFLLIAAMNPCPCGGVLRPSSPPWQQRRGDRRQRCRCSTAVLSSYAARISGPLLDRFDIRVPIQPISSDVLFDEGGAAAESSHQVAERVVRARKRREQRGQKSTNRDLEWKDRQRWAPLSSGAKQFFIDCGDEGGLTTRGMTRLLRLSRTISDLRGGDLIEESDLIEALSLRGTGRIET
ncbi:MAG: YifB family Mg chelatase-like AAA ATPase [Planctomycetota bacterium]